MASEIAALQMAVSSFDEGHYEQVLQTLEAMSTSGSMVAKSLWHAATALIAERDGDAAAADANFQQAHDCGAPLPAVLLACARHFKKTGQYEKAHHDYSVLQNLTPGVIDEFLQGLPDSELSRYSPWKVRRMLQGTRPNLYGLQRYKQALFEQLGAQGAALAFAQLAGLASGWSVDTLPLVSLRTYAEAQASVYEKMISGELRFFPPPEVFGGSERPGFQLATRDFFFCVLDDALVSSKSNFVLTGGVALLDFQGDEMEKIPVDLNVDPIVLGSADSTVTVLRAGPSAQLPIPAALSLVGIHSSAFGHWILEFLPKVWACLDRPGFAAIPILIDAQMPPQHLQALQFFIGADHPIRVLKAGENVQVRRLWICSMIVYMPPGSRPGTDIAPDAVALDGRGYAALIEKMRPRLEAMPEKSGPKRICLTRKDTQHRKLINRQEIESWLIDRGFSMIDFADVPFVEQIELVRGADIVLGPHGSAFLATFFARPSVRIGIFNHEYLDDFEWYSETFRALGLRHSTLVGETVNRNAKYLAFSDYRIDLEKLAAFLEHLQTMP